MNEFIEQFLIEARELVEQGTDDLLALETRPDDRERLDSAFRAFHTLKGAAGIIDFAAMARALHAAEDVLSAVRNAAEPVTPALIGDGLSALDQVLQWLDAIEATGEPPMDADTAADAIVARFAGMPAAPVEAETVQPATQAWLDALLTAFPDAGDRATVALVYRPAADSFFRQRDPLALVEGVPGLLGLRLTPSEAWPDLDLFDPFTCQLTVTALSTAPRSEVEQALQPVLDQIELVDLSPGLPGGPPVHQALLEAQILMLGVADADGLSGRMASAARVCANLLRNLDRAAEIVPVELALARSLDAGNAAPLTAAIRALIDQPVAPSEASPALPVPTPLETARSLRIDVERIDALVRLTGELTVIKNAIGHLAGQTEDGADAKVLAARLKDQHGLLDRLVGEFHHAVLSIRVLPLRHVFQRFPRLVRELGLSLGKPVELIVEGDETQADKAIVEGLFEPLLHVVRNAVDHGLEDAGTRAASGKPPTGQIRLRAERRGEHVVIEVEDDGGGVDVARVRQVAEARGVATAQTLAALSEAGVIDLIFAPGFSTAAQVTDVSGRGVGMDAVRAAVERMGGRATIVNRPGLGAAVRFTLPFSVMMSRVMTVEAAGQAFGVPLEAVIETVRIPRDSILPVGAAQAFVLRGRTIPLLDLANTLGTRESARHTDDAIVVVAQVAGQRVGLEVDRLGGRMDVMLKPMEGLLAGMRGVAGTTLLGDGRVLIVLDLQELLE
ncbi:chemotaxis protein CheA [Caulobacter sp. S45]|uniref:chemotaxis protein CheA n=1 Tax=Caulobacter sp. S45 TaxID=1641861 RepID=UPI00131CFAEC|nr:chemotaxis protein CheA [Caulobacter sp. S45]